MMVDEIHSYHLMPMCGYCKHWYPREPMAPRLCTAFPDGIPDAILHWEFDHRQPMEGDHGIQFEVREGSEEDWAVWLDLYLEMRDIPFPSLDDDEEETDA